MTVFVRPWPAPPAPEDNITPGCPTLAVLVREISDRKYLMRDTPLFVDAATYENAEAEMLAIRQRRGYSTLERASLSAPNFLLFGVPIVTETDGNG